MKEILTVNRLNARIIEAVRYLGEISEVTKNLIDSPSQESVNRLAEIVKTYSGTSDEMLAAVEAVLRHLQGSSDDEDGIEVVGEITEEGIRLNG